MNSLLKILYNTLIELLFILYPIRPYDITRRARIYLLRKGLIHYAYTVIDPNFSVRVKLEWMTEEREQEIMHECEHTMAWCVCLVFDDFISIVSRLDSGTCFVSSHLVLILFCFGMLISALNLKAKITNFIA